MKFLRILLLLAFPVYLFSCGAQRKTPNYVENLTDTSGKGEVKIPELKIQKSDLLSIQVYSTSTQPEKSDILYNLPASAGGGGTATGGILVDANGDIEYPRLGTFHAEGLTKQELAALIKKKITDDNLLTNPNIIIRFLNFRITILGPVAREGTIQIPSERVTILEAVGLAGGLTDYAKRSNVKVIRETNGKREIGLVDLSSKDIFESPYYNLVQNDMIIIEPTKQKARMVDQSIVAQRISLAVGLITSAAFIYNIFK